MADRLTDRAREAADHFERLAGAVEKIAGAATSSGGGGTTTIVNNFGPPPGRGSITIGASGTGGSRGTSTIGPSGTGGRSGAGTISNTGGGGSGARIAAQDEIARAMQFFGVAGPRNQFSDLFIQQLVEAFRRATASGLETRKLGMS